MTDALLLDQAGRVQGSMHQELLDPNGVPFAMARNVQAGWNISRGDIPRYDELPDSVKRQLEKMDVGRVGFSAFEPRMSMQTWEETLYATIADGTAVTSSSETIMVPDYTLPANYLIPGRTLRYTIWYRQSTAITTPGTITLRLRYGGVGGTLICASGAFAPDSTAAATNLTAMVQYQMTCRSAGSSGTVIGFGFSEWSDYDDASAAALVGNLNMRLIPTSAPATATVNTTTANALSPTYQSSVATASMTAHLAVLESMS